MFIASPLTIAKKRKQPECPNGKEDVVYINNGVLLSCKKKKKKGCHL